MTARIAVSAPRLDCFVTNAAFRGTVGAMIFGVTDTIEPYDRGMLDVGDGQRIAWEQSGIPGGKPAVVLHGGPGSGSNPAFRWMFDPGLYRIVQFDQRGCGRSTPSAADPAVGLGANTTQHLVRDCETLRAHLGIDRWLVWGGSWGTTLGLAYAEAHPERVSEMVLVSLATTTRREVEWVTRAMGRVFPEEWHRFRDAVPVAERDGNLAAAYARMLASPDAEVREQAAREWCAWEETHVATTPGRTRDSRFDDPGFRMVFARLTTHYWSNAAFLDDGQLLRNAGRLAGIPGVLIAGRLDFSGPPDVAWELARAWPDAELIIVDDAGHGAGYHSTFEAIIAATNRLAN
jgi:proline iminopeptidase